MFKLDQHIRRRVHIGHRHGGLSARIERQNTRGVYLWIACFSTLVFVMFARVILDTIVRHREDALYISPIFLPGLALYVLALVDAMWGAFGIEEICVEGGTVSWTLTALRWSHTRIIPVQEITDIKAITRWYRFDNTVEITTHRKSQRLGYKLLHDEAIELADKLRQAVGCSSGQLAPELGGRRRS
jgi:hypothetical protein